MAEYTVKLDCDEMEILQNALSGWLEEQAGLAQARKTNEGPLGEALEAHERSLRDASDDELMQELVTMLREGRGHVTQELIDALREGIAAGNKVTPELRERIYEAFGIIDLSSMFSAQYVDGRNLRRKLVNISGGRDLTELGC